MDCVKSISTILILLLTGQNLLVTVNGACSWPAAFASSQWHDSARGMLTFGTTNMQGWSFTPTTGTTISSWDCVTNSTYNTDGRIIMITANSFSLFSTTYYAYLCITVNQVTSVSYRYYINHDIQTNVNYERLFIYPVKTLTDPGTICSSTGATGGEYIMLTKEGSQSFAKIDCPWFFLGTYGYTHTTSQGAASCDKINTEMDLCTNTKEISFDYTQCQTKVAYSASSTVWCVDNVPSGGVNYVMLYNGLDATVDDVSTFRFTCMSVSEDATSASVSPRYCQPGQTATAYPVKPSGISTGARLSFSAPRVTCSTCPRLTSPPYGNVTISTTGSVTTSTYACNQNYTLWGSNTRACQTSSMTWTGSIPTCSCSSPPDPISGDVTVNWNGSVATYICSAGYTLNGLATRNCQLATATWQGTDPSCTQCASLLTIGGQSRSVSTNGTMTSVTFGCVVGYTLVGTASLTCNASGSWDGQQPNCVQCPVLTNQPSGYVTTSTTGTVTTATYACAAGYTLQGSSTRTCLQNATWTSSEPVCFCNNPASPTNGAVVANGSLATYTCTSGFTISGDSVRTCQKDGSGWSSTVPKCTKCTTLAAVTGGSYTLSTTGTVTSAHYTCIVGYSLDGVSTITCQADGSWSSISPTCVQCPTLANPSSGSVTLSTSGIKTSATYACASGYNLNGNTIRLCNSDGTWSLMAPTCTCQSPSIPTNGAVVANGVTANYTCSQGHSLNGASVRTCGVNSTGWSGVDPTCSTCATLTTPTGGAVTLSTDGINTKAAYTCSSGYTLNGVTPITCRSDGSWVPSAPTCVNGTCTWPVAFESSQWHDSVRGMLTFGTTNMQGWSFTPTIGTTLSSWDCVSVSTFNTDGRIIMVTTDPFYIFATNYYAYLCMTVTQVTSVSYRYYINYVMQTNVNYERLFVYPVKTLIDPGTICSDTGAIGGEYVMLIKAGYQSTAKIDCPWNLLGIYGYSHTSSQGMTSCSKASSEMDLCTNTKEISFNYTQCQTKVAYSVSSTVWCVDNVPSGGVNYVMLYNGLDVTVDDVSTFRFTCMAVSENATIASISPKYCQSSQTATNFPLRPSGTPTGALLSLSAPKATCLCSSPPKPFYGNVTVSSNGSVAFYTCNSGYTLNGLASRKCESATATWEGTDPTCVACPMLTNPPSGSITFFTNGTITTATYACASQYSLLGSSTRTCLQTGTWTNSEPVCYCNSPLSPMNGAVVDNGVTANYTCNHEHFLNGSSTRSCGTDGSGWDGVDPTCSPHTVGCMKPSSPTNGVVVANGSFAMYTCNLGFTLYGDDVRTCQANSSTWSNREPSCTQCEVISNFTDGQLWFYSNGTITMVLFTCPSGTTLIGSETAVCNDEGKWRTDIPNCKIPEKETGGDLSSTTVVAIGIAAGCGIAIIATIINVVVFCKRGSLSKSTGHDYIQPSVSLVESGNENYDVITGSAETSLRTYYNTQSTDDTGAYVTIHA